MGGSPIRKSLLKTSIVLIGLLIGLAMAELALRFYYHSRQDRIVYIKNKEGFRDVDHSVPKPPGTLHIAFQGDSFTYGQGVDFPHIFSTRVGDILRQKIPDRKIEVFNFGKPGLNVLGDLDNIITYVQKYDPDMIIFGYVLNDFSDTRMDNELIRDSRKEIDRFKVFRRFEKRSKLAYFIDWILFQQFSDARRIHLQWLRATYAPQKNPRYLEMKDALNELIRLVSRRHGLVVFYPYLVSRGEDHLDFYNRSKHLVSAICDEYRCPFLEVLPLLESKPYYRWWVSADDHHPNSGAHEIIAGAIAERILENLK